MDYVKFGRDGDYMVVMYKDQDFLFKRTPCYHSKNEPAVFIDVEKNPTSKNNTILSEEEVKKMIEDIIAFVKKAGVKVRMLDKINDSTVIEKKIYRSTLVKGRKTSTKTN